MIGTLRDDLCAIAYLRRAVLPVGRKVSPREDGRESQGGPIEPQDAASATTDPAELGSSLPHPGAIARWKSATGRLLALLIFAVAPAVVIPVLIVLLHHHHNFAFDFQGWYWVAGHRVLHGLSPYSLPVNKAFNYPAIAALLFVPFALIPPAAAGWIFGTPRRLGVTSGGAGRLGR